MSFQSKSTRPGEGIADLTTAFPTSFVYVDFDPKSNAKRKNAKGHAIRQGILIKRQNQSKAGGNFKHYHPSPTPLQWEPFDILPVASAQLRRLLNTPSASRLVEPVFSLEGDNSFLSYQTVFRTGFQDEALPYALMTLLTHQQSSKTDHYKYKSATISVIQQRLASTQAAVLPSTIGAILLLASTECHIENGQNTQTHLAGVKKILDLADKNKTNLPSQLRRAVFWQDLNSSILIGTTRVFEASYFIQSSESNLIAAAVIPRGFEMYHTELGDEFLAVLSQFAQLESMCDHVGAALMSCIDDQQALIEDHLYHCWNNAGAASNILLQACALAGYICTYMMHTDIWQNHRIPSACAFKLLLLLKEHDWSTYTDLYLWLLVIGGTFATQSVKPRYTILLQKSFDISESNWANVEHTLQRFIFPRKISHMCKESWNALIS